MGWLGKILMWPVYQGGKLVVKAVGAIIHDFIYEWIILLGLKILKVLEMFFEFLSTKGPQLFLFNIKYQDGKNILSTDFFTHPSPLQTGFLVAMGVAGGLSIVFLMLGIVKSIQSKDGNPSKVVKTMATWSGGLASLTFVPLIVIFALSGVSAITQMFSGKVPTPPSYHDTQKYKNNIARDGYNSLISAAGGTAALETLYAHNSIDDTTQTITNNGGAISNGIVVPKYNTPQNPNKWSYENYALDGSTPHEDGFLKTTTLPVSSVPFNYNLIDIKKGDNIGNTVKTLMSNMDQAFNPSPNGNGLDQDMQTEIDKSSTLQTAYQAVKNEYDALIAPNQDNEIKIKGTRINANPFSGTLNTWSQGFIQHMNNMKSVIGSMSDTKDEKKADEIRADIGYFTKVAELLSNYKMASSALITQLEDSGFGIELLNGATPLDPSKWSSQLSVDDGKKSPAARTIFAQQRLVQQVAYIGTYKQVMNRWITYGDGSLNKNPSWVQPHSLQEISINVSRLIVGSPAISSGTGQYLSLASLKTQLTTVSDGALVVTMYQIASGHSDANWDQIASDANWGSMFVGFVAIMFSIVLMTQLIMYATMRIFDIGILFIVSPFFIFAAAEDDGAKFKNWMSMMFAKILSIVAVVIGFSLIGPVLKGLDNVWSTHEGHELLQAVAAANPFQGAMGNDIEFLGKCVVKLFIVLAALIASKQGGIMVASIFGANAGIAEAFSQTQAIKGAMKMAGGVGKGIGKIGKGVAGGAGFVAANSGLTAASRAEWSARGEIAKGKLEGAKNAGSKTMDKARAISNEGFKGSKQTREYINKGYRELNADRSKNPSNIAAAAKMKQASDIRANKFGNQIKGTFSKGKK